MKKKYGKLLPFRQFLSQKNEIINWKVIMGFKIFCLCTFLFCIQSKAEVFSQTITLQSKSIRLEHVFDHIEKQSNYVVLYDLNDIKQLGPIVINKTNAPLRDFLHESLKDKPLQYSIDDKTIFITRKKKDLTPATITSTASRLDDVVQRTISGRIRNEKGEPLEGVSITEKGNSKGTTSDREGQFTLNVQSAKPILMFRSLGYQPLEMLSPQSPVQVLMKAELSNLDEVVVVGYGTVNKADLTGAVASVDLKELSKAPVLNFTEALAGRSAGVQVTGTEGQPGQEPQIVIRGAGTLTQDASPLYVVDGYPVEDFSAASINTNDIENISILKDASATAIYGARAANGVIVIETKKGKVGKAVVNFNGNYGVQSLRKHMDVMESYEFVKYQQEFSPTVATNRYFQDGKVLDDYKNIKSTNWQDHLFVDAPYQQNNFSIRGANLDTRYAISGAVNDAAGIILNTGAKRYQGRVNLDHSVNKYLKVGINASYTKNTVYGVQASSVLGNSTNSYLFYSTWGYRPVSGQEGMDLNDIDQDDIPLESDPNTRRVNPYQVASNTYNYNIGTALFTNAFIQINLRQNLILKSTGNISNNATTIDNFYNSRTPRGLPVPQNTRGVQASTQNIETSGYANENTLTFNQKWNTHQLNALVGFSIQSGKAKARGVTVSNIPNEQLGMSGFDEGIPYETVSTSGDFSMASYFGRVNYSYASKYFLTATYRMDGSSKFPSVNRWGYFPSMAIAWNMAKEKFMKGIPAISTSKLRFSYGLTGNNRVSNYAWHPSLSFPVSAMYSFENRQPEKGVVQNDLGNTDLKWETTHQMDLGYDLGLYKNKIEVTVDVYRKTTKDLLLNADLPFFTGYSTVYQNIGKIENKGLEISLNTKNINKKKFSWTSNFNISFNRNKVLELVQDQNEMFRNNLFHFNYTSAFNITEVGQPAGMFYGYNWLGNYQYADFDEISTGQYRLKDHISDNGKERQSIQPGDIKYQDRNGDLKITDSDRQVIGNPLPKHIGGFGNTFTYGALDLHVFFQWVYGNDIYNANRIIFEGNSLQITDLNQYKSYENRWTPTNQNNTYFRTGGSGPVGMHSSRVVEDGSFVRLKTLSLGYTLPEKWVNKAQLSNVRLNVSAQNLMTWTSYSGMDPEVSVRNSVLTPGLDYSAYPHARTFVLGISANLKN